jgi:hypothetical protein
MPNQEWGNRVSTATIAAICAILAVAGQVVNFLLYLLIRNAILESEAKLKDWADARFVRLPYPNY